MAGEQPYSMCPLLGPDLCGKFGQDPRPGYLFNDQPHLPLSRPRVKVAGR